MMPSCWPLTVSPTLRLSPATGWGAWGCGPGASGAAFASPKPLATSSEPPRTAPAAVFVNVFMFAPFLPVIGRESRLRESSPHSPKEGTDPPKGSRLLPRAADVAAGLHKACRYGENPNQNLMMWSRWQQYFRPLT